VLRIHPETVCLFFFAALSIACNSSRVTRTRKVPALACPFGRGGLPAFLAFFCFGIPKLLNDCCPHRQDRRSDRRDMQHGHMTTCLFTVVHIVRPCVNLWRFRMAVKLEHFNDSFPHSLALKCLFYGHALNVNGVHAMQAPYHFPKFLYVSRRHYAPCGSIPKSQLENPLMEYLHILVFICPTCKNPILAPMICANSPCSDEFLEKQDFQLACSKPGCIWKARMYGREAVQKLAPLAWSHRIGSGHRI
jgi:hypothetical protein